MANTKNKSKKPMSKRTPVRLRHKIEKASAAKGRKERKLAKKNPEWRTKLKKDPGIPNLFPYKEKLLHEIEERKLQKQEEMARKKMVKAARTGTVEADGVTDGGDFADFGGDTMDVDDDVDEDANPMAALLASARTAAKQYEQDIETDEDGEGHEFEIEDEDENRGATSGKKDQSRKAFDKAFKDVVDRADVVLYVLDARDPEGTRSRDVERSVMAAAAGGKRLILILNKVDLIPPPILRGWLAHLRRYFPTIPLRASGPAANARTYNHRDLSIQTTSNALMRSLKSFAASRNMKRAVTVGVIGYPNVGKSSVINALLSRFGGKSNACPAGAEAGVTTSIRSVKIDSKLTLLDSPGIVFPSVSNPAGAAESKLSKEDAKAHLVLLNAVPPKNIDDPVRAVSLLFKRLSSSPDLLQNLLDVYETPPLIPRGGDITTDFLLHVARKRGRLGKGGIPNLESSAMTVITDWRDGRIQGWVEAPKLPATQVTKDDDAAGMKQVSAESTGDDQVAPDQKKFVAQWSEEFKLVGLFDDAPTEEGDAMEM